MSGCVLLLAGRKGSGKSTCAAHLRRRFPGVVADSFAAPLKPMALAILKAMFPATCGDWTVDTLNDLQVKERPFLTAALADQLEAALPDFEQPPIFEMTPEIGRVSRAAAVAEAIHGVLGLATPRRLMQSLGTEACRAHLGDDVWAKALLARVLGRQVPVTVVDDVRFPNELQTLRGASWGGGVPRRSDLASCRVIKLVCTDDADVRDLHPSETALDVVDPAKWDEIVSCGRSEGSEVLLEMFDAALERLVVRDAALARGLELSQ